MSIDDALKAIMELCPQLDDSQMQAIEAILSTYGASRYAEGYRSSLKKVQGLLDKATTRIKKLGPL